MYIDKATNYTCVCVCVYVFEIMNIIIVLYTLTNTINNMPTSIMTDPLQYGNGNDKKELQYMYCIKV